MHPLSAARLAVAALLLGNVESFDLAFPHNGSTVQWQQTGEASTVPTPTPARGVLRPVLSTALPTAAASTAAPTAAASTVSPTTAATTASPTAAASTASPTAAASTAAPTAAASTVSPTVAASTASPTKHKGPPNFLFLLADDMGYGEISIMPGRRNFNVTTPNIDNFFKEGMRFTDFYANQECAPSRCALMTGKHLGHSTIRTNSFRAGLLPSDVTFLQVLGQAADYKVSCIGKWHLSGSRKQVEYQFQSNPAGAPWNKGCDRFLGAEVWSDYYSQENVYRYNLLGGLQELKFPGNIGASRDRCMAANNTCIWLTDLNLQEALNELEYHKARQNAEAAAGMHPAPFFLYLAWTDPHLGSWVDEKNAPNGNPVPSNADFANHTTWPNASKDHAADVESYHDRYVKIVLDKLDELELRENTVVVYTSDNGAPKSSGEFFSSAGPLLGWKTWLTEGGIRVPAAIRWPGEIANGTISNEPLAFWDFFPTFLDIARVPEELWPADLDGVSFYQGVLKQELHRNDEGSNVSSSFQFTHPPLYWESCSGMGMLPDWAAGRPDTESTFTRAVRIGRWKGYQAFLKGEFSGLRVYDMILDPGETTDVAGQNKDIARQLAYILDSPGIRTDSVGLYNYTAADEGCLTWYGNGR